MCVCVCVCVLVCVCVFYVREFMCVCGGRVGGWVGTGLGGKGLGKIGYYFAQSHLQTSKDPNNYTVRYLLVR